MQASRKGWEGMEGEIFPIVDWKLFAAWQLCLWSAPFCVAKFSNPAATEVVSHRVLMPTPPLLAPAPAGLGLDDRPDGAHTVFPRNLFSLGIRAARVGDPDFVNAKTHARGSGGEFRLNAETGFA